MKIVAGSFLALATLGGAAGGVLTYQSLAAPALPVAAPLVPAVTTTAYLPCPPSTTQEGESCVTTVWVTPPGSAAEAAPAASAPRRASVAAVPRPAPATRSVVVEPPVTDAPKRDTHDSSDDDEHDREPAEDRHGDDHDQDED